jgi:hypothetical protein
MSRLGNRDDKMESWREFAKKVSEAMKRAREERTKDGKITVTRMVEVTYEVNREGYCRNFSEPRMAGDMACGVGIIRRGRDWGDYGAIVCAECPYWEPDPARACVGSSLLHQH